MKDNIENKVKHSDNDDAGRDTGKDGWSCPATKMDDTIAENSFL